MYPFAEIARIYIFHVAHSILSDVIHVVSYKVYIHTYVLWCVYTFYRTCFYSRLRARNTSAVTNIHVTSTIKMNIFQIFAIGMYTHTYLEYIPLAWSIFIFPSFLILIKRTLKNLWITRAKTDEWPKINFILFAIDLTRFTKSFIFYVK